MEVQPIARKKVLFVEDSFMIREGYRDIADRLGFDAVFAACMDEFLWLAPREWDAVVLDHRLIGCTGEDIYAEIKKLGWTCPVIAASSFQEGVYEGAVKRSKMEIRATLHELLFEGVPLVDAGRSKF